MSQLYVRSVCGGTVRTRGYGRGSDNINYICSQNDKQALEPRLPRECAAAGAGGEQPEPTWRRWQGWRGPAGCFCRPCSRPGYESSRPNLQNDLPARSRHPQDQVRTREWRGKGGGGVPGSRLGGAGLGALGIPDLSAPEQVLESGQTWRLRTGLSCPKAGALRGS